MKWLIPFTKVNSSNIERHETGTVSASMSGIFLNYIYIYIHIYIKCACLNITESILAQSLGLCSSSLLLATQTLYQTQSQRHYWNVDWLIALYLHHFWCFYSCVPPVLLLVCFFDSPCFSLFVCMWMFLVRMCQSDWVGRKSTFLIILVNRVHVWVSLQ